MSRERVERVVGGYQLFNEGKLDQALEGFPDDIEWVVLGSRSSRPMISTITSVVIMRVRGTGRDSGAAVDSPAFAAVWTWHDDESLAWRCS